MKHQYLVPCLIFFLGGPLGIVIHEFGHYMAGITLGYDEVHYSYRRVNFETENLSTISHGIFLAAGPAIDLTWAIVGIALLARRVAAHNYGFGYWIATFLAVVSVRWIKTAVEGPGSDEAKISELLGWPWFALPAVMAVFAVPALLWIFRLHYRAGTHRHLLCGLVAEGAGIALWMGVVGPALFAM